MRGGLKESTLTQILIDKLQRGEISKISRAKNRVVNYSKEIGTTSVRTDVFITFSKKDSEQDFKTNGATFVAIEVKIKDWKQGLYQAYRYNQFAERSYLALYSEYAKGINIKLFKKYNVGLIIFDNEKIVVRNKPKRNKFVEDELCFSLRENLWQKSLAMECR